MPSLKNALSASALRFRNGSTATDVGAAATTAAHRPRVGVTGPLQLAQRALQVGADVGGVLVAQVAILLEQLVEDRDDRGGSAGFRVLRRHRRAVQDRRPRCTPVVAPVKRAAAGRHLVQHEPEREQIGALIDAARRAPARAPCRPAVPIVTPGPGQRRHRRRLARLVVDQLGDAEVEHLHVAARGDDDVGRLQVAVDDAAGVRRVERVGELHAPLDHLLDRQRPAARAAACSVPPSSSSITR